MAVAPWLIGVWKRGYIKRRLSNGMLGDADTSIDVLYIQTPWVFIDIRSRKMIAKNDGCKTVVGKEKPMAFAGITTFTDAEAGHPPLVRWHACLDMDEPNMDCSNRWEEAESGNPRQTSDVGYFEQKSLKENTYLEYDPDKTYEEQWIKIDNCNESGKRILAVRHIDGQQLLVICGEYFAYANQQENIFVSGRIVRNDAGVDCQYNTKNKFKIEGSASDISLVGQEFELSKNEDLSNWKVLTGSTLPKETMRCLIS